MDQSTVSPLSVLARQRAPFAPNWIDASSAQPSDTSPMTPDQTEPTDETDAASPLRALARNRRPNLNADSQP